MLPPGVRLATFLVGASVIASSVGASAQPDGVRMEQPASQCVPPSAMARPSPPAAMARPSPPAMARPAPPAMARPAAPAFRAAPPPQRPAMAPSPAPRIAAPPQRAAPRMAGPRPEFRRDSAPPPRRPAVAPPRTPEIAATPDRRGAPSALSADHPRQERIERREQQRVQRQQAMQERQRDSLSRQSVQRQERIDRLQQRVQRLQSEQPQGRWAQRSLQGQERLLRREQQLQQRQLARQERLGIQPSARESGLATGAPPRRRRLHAGDSANASATMTVRGQKQYSRRGEHGWAPRHAWRRGHRAVFVAWLGPVFWPYAYSDIFNYTFWPDAYDTGYWAYAYDDLLDTVFWGESGPYSAYARLHPGEPARSPTALSSKEFRQLCGDPEGGVTAWPFASIVQAVQPTPEQRALLDELKRAAAKAADEFKRSCGDSYAMTPPAVCGR